MPIVRRFATALAILALGGFGLSHRAEGAIITNNGLPIGGGAVFAVGIDTLGNLFDDSTGDPVGFLRPPPPPAPLGYDPIFPLSADIVDQAGCPDPNSRGDANRSGNRLNRLKFNWIDDLEVLDANQP